MSEGTLIPDFSPRFPFSDGIVVALKLQIHQIHFRVISCWVDLDILKNIYIYGCSNKIVMDLGKYREKSYKVTFAKVVSGKI